MRRKNLEDDFEDSKIASMPGVTAGYGGDNEVCAEKPQLSRAVGASAGGQALFGGDPEIDAGAG